MGVLIHLAAPLPAGPDAARLYVSAGRSLTAADLAMQSRYVDARLLGLAPAAWGVLNGLGVSPARYDSPDGATGLATFTIGAGTGIGSDGRLVRVSAPISVSWSDLLAAMGPAGTLADGTYLLLARTVAFDGVDGPPPDPAGRAAPDPLLDLQQISFVEIWLSPPIGTLPAATTPAALALALNTLVAGLTPTSLGAAAGNGVPLAVVLARGNQAILLSQAAGRLPATPAALNALLLAQTREAFAMALAAPDAAPAAAAWQAQIQQRFRLLPPAGELPLGMLLTPTAVTASCPFFPPGMAVCLQAIRASQAANLMTEAMGHPALDVTGGTAEAVTLALAVPDASWAPDLLDIPRGDPVLAADLHLAYARARAAQVKLREAWIALYGGINAVTTANPQPLGFLAAADTAAQNLNYLLANGTIPETEVTAAADEAATPAALLAWIAARLASLTTLQTSDAPPPAALPTTTPAQATQLLTTLGYQLADTEPAPADPSAAPYAPPTSDTLLAPLFQALPPNSSFAAWSAAIGAAAPDPVLLQPLIDAGIVDPGTDAATQAAAIEALLALPASGDPLNDDTQPGALLTLAVLQLFYAVLVRLARAQEYRLSAHTRFMALQRQHLDIMSTSVSALAGGVPSDGSGLSFTRMIPFFSLSQPAPTAAAPAVTTSAPQRMMLARSFTPSIARAEAAPAAMAPAATAPAAELNARPIVRATPAAGGRPATPTYSLAAAILGSDADVAQNVALDAGALSQAPPFTFTPIQVGAAAHITPGATLLQISSDGLTNLRKLMADERINLTPANADQAAKLATAATEEASYSNILQLNVMLLGDINQVETQAIQIEAAYLQFRDRIQSLETRIAQQTATLAAARDALVSAQGSAARAGGDYAAAQQLLQEEVARVAAATAARTAAIGAASGLFYVRALQTAITRRPPPALALASDTPDDLAPGCPADHPGPPAALQPFLEQLLEIPLGDWRPLQNRWTDLPDIAGMQRLAAVRRVRLANRAPGASFGAGAAATGLAALSATTESVFAPLFRTDFVPAASLAVSQQSAFQLFAPPDIAALPASLLRTQSETLRARLESAAGCLFEALTALPPSARFAWASLARAGTLPPLAFAQWPIPAALGATGTATLRRLAGLVTWIGGQLQDAPSAAAQTALGNLVTATVIAAAYGDPDDAVTGTLASTGGVPRPGVPIRVVLNRRPPIGTVLNLLDDRQSVVGTLRVQDHDANGTTATVVTSFAATPPTSAWSVAVPGRRAPWLPS
jgi:uncharacterized coiled-coil protein SlyX